MQLNHIVKSLLITGLFTTSSLPLLAAEAPKDATAATPTSKQFTLQPVAVF